MASTDVESATVAQIQPQQPEEPERQNDSEKDEVVVADAGTSKSEIAQMEIQNAPAAFVGLGKEDLMILANRPFWVRLRWALFITFWVLWLGLLVGAALIIALSPGCELVDQDIKSTSASQGHR